MKEIKPSNSPLSRTRWTTKQAEGLLFFLRKHGFWNDSLKAELSEYGELFITRKLFLEGYEDLNPTEAVSLDRFLDSCVRLDNKRYKQFTKTKQKLKDMQRTIQKQLDAL